MDDNITDGMEVTQDAVLLDDDDIVAMDEEPVPAPAPALAPEPFDGSTHFAPDNVDAVAEEDANQDELIEGTTTTSEVKEESPAKPRLHAIEVVLTPPPDPETYERIPLSWRVERVTEEVEIGDELFYSVEFDDGRIDQVAFDDLQQLRGGRRAERDFQEQRFALNQPAMAVHSTKRRRQEDEYEDSESDYEIPHKKRKHTLPTRKSSRQASRQQSADNDEDNFDSDDGMNGFGDDDIDDDEDEDMINPRQSKGRASMPASSSTARVTRSHDTRLQKPVAQLESEDELAQDSNSDYGYDTIPVVRSDLAPALRTSARKRKRPKKSGQSSRNAASDSDIEFEPARRSGRSGRNLKSMRDPEVEDEYGAAEEKATNAPKYVAIKETFQPLPPDSDFPRMHIDNCDTCRTQAHGSRNSLVYCQGCSNAYHKNCLGQRSARDQRVTKVGPDEFVLQCKYCIGLYKQKDPRAPVHALCQTCKLKGTSCAEFSPKKTPKQEEKIRQENGGEDPIHRVDPELINNADNVLFRCSTCRRGYHFDHLPPMHSQEVAPEDVKEDRLTEYSMVDWKCKDCLVATQRIHALVAWRPVDQGAHGPGQTSQDFAEDDIEYLVKWEGRSHFHDEWMPGAWVHGVAAHAMRTSFHKRESAMLPKMDKKDAIEEEWLLADVFLNVTFRGRARNSTKAQDMARIDDVKSVYVKFQGLGYEEAVWDEPPPRDSGAPWNAFVAAYDEYLNGKYFTPLADNKMRERVASYRSLDFGKECELKSQPPGLKRGKLMEYQLEGVNYLLFNYHQQQNVILADEMGLGKTVQIVAFISSLVQDQPKCWPFLIVVPNSTCPNWRRELKQWAPDLRVVTFHGGKIAQDLAYRHELFPEGPSGGMKAHVVIMSYEAAGNVKTVFNTVKWVGLIVDEGQRLKNEDTQLYKSLQEMKIPCRILLTGTPLQNNKRELFNLLQFIDPKHNAEKLDEEYAELTKENLPKLHSIIRPYFLRRTKAQVLKFLPPMAQIILPVTMTVLQEKLSKSIMARNPDLIRAIVSKDKIKAKERKSLSNILMDLRQCLCHPFCFNSDVEDKTVDGDQLHRNLVSASPKLLLLDIMLPKLKERGHRVLIFSQFLLSLTIIEDFLTGINLPHARIDGNLSALEKQKRIDAFNVPGSPLFAMLLSTRAGGVGINLATADTVIIYDPDFNPHQDIQALSRAHRIGQKDKVLCFQFTTKNTVEEKIMQMGRKKMALDHALIESMDSAEDAGEDLESILKHGAAALFSGESKDKITYDSASIDKLLDRSKIEDTNTGEDQSAENQFSFARVWANDESTFNDNLDDSMDNDSTPADPAIWENILKERQEEHERQHAADQREFGRGRRRAHVSYNDKVGFIEGLDDYDLLTSEQRPEPDSGASDVDVEDELYIDNNEVEDDYESEGYGEIGQSLGPSKGKGTKGTNHTMPGTTDHPNKRAKAANTPASNNKRSDPTTQVPATGNHGERPGDHSTGQLSQQRTETILDAVANPSEQPSLESVANVPNPEFSGQESSAGVSASDPAATDGLLPTGPPS